MALGYVQLGSGNENAGIFPAGANINGGDDQFSGYQGAAASTYSNGLQGMRNALTGLGGVFSVAYVDKLSFNDLVFALKSSGG